MFTFIICFSDILHPHYTPKRDFITAVDFISQFVKPHPFRISPVITRIANIYAIDCNDDFVVRGIPSSFRFCGILLNKFNQNLCERIEI